jgi:hypothetical protein
MAMSSGAKVAVGVGVAAGVATGGILAYDLIRRKNTSSSGTSGGNTGTSSETSSGAGNVSPSDIGFGLGMASVSQLALLRGGARLYAVTLGASGSPVSGGTNLGQSTFGALSGLSGQRIHMPVTVTNKSNNTLQFALAGYEWENETTLNTVSFPGLGTFGLAGHMNVGGAWPNAYSFSLAAGQSTTTNSESAGLLSALPDAIGLYYQLHVYDGSGNEFSWSPLNAWTNAFVTISVGSGQAGFGFGTPSVSLLRRMPGRAPSIDLLERRILSGRR